MVAVGNKRLSTGRTDAQNDMFEIVMCRNFKDIAERIIAKER